LRIRATDSASATPTPPVRVDGTALLVGPALIGRRQRIVLSALVEGEPSDLRCEAPLPNARVRRQRDPSKVQERLARLTALATGMAAALLALYASAFIK
jgi:hypothetical protein